MNKIDLHKIDLRKICVQGNYLEFQDYIDKKNIKLDIDYLYEITYVSYNNKRNVLNSDKTDDYVCLLKKLIDLGARPKTSNEFYGYFYRKLLS